MASPTTLSRRRGGIDGHLDLGLAGLVVDAENVAMVVGADGLGGVAGAHLLAADDQRDLDLLDPSSR